MRYSARSGPRHTLSFSLSAPAESARIAARPPQPPALAGMAPQRDAQRRLEALEHEADVLSHAAPPLPLSSAILAAEIARVRALATGGAEVPEAGCTDGEGTHGGTRKRIRLKVPAERYPEYNFVGRLLGPRGATLKKLERETGCKIMIRGRGSIRKDKEADVRGKPGWEHVFNEHLHVVIEVSDAPDEVYAMRALNRAKEQVELLLVPVPEEKDTLKRQQLRDLAILNGTYRSSDSAPPPGASAPPPALYHPHYAMPPPQATYGHSCAFSSNGVSYGAVRSTGHGMSVGATSPSMRASGGRSVPSGAGAGVGGIRIPALDIEVMSESFLASPPASTANGIPVPSPTIVDPDMYPFPPTPSLVGGEGATGTTTSYGSPIWSPLHSGGNAPPPMSAPLSQSGQGYFSLGHQQQQGVHVRPASAAPPQSPRGRAGRRTGEGYAMEAAEIGGQLSPLSRSVQQKSMDGGGVMGMGHSLFRLSSPRQNGDPGRTDVDGGDLYSSPSAAVTAAALGRRVEETKFFEDTDLTKPGL